MLKKIFFIGLLLGGITPLFAHGEIFPSWFATAIWVAFALFSALILWAIWKVKFLRYWVLPIILVFMLWGVYEEITYDTNRTEN